MICLIKYGQRHLTILYFVILFNISLLSSFCLLLYHYKKGSCELLFDKSTVFQMKLKCKVGGSLTLACHRMFINSLTGHDLKWIAFNFRKKYKGLDSLLKKNHNYTFPLKCAMPCHNTIPRNPSTR